MRARDRDLFHVESDCRDRVQVLVELQPVQDSRLAGRVEAEHQNPVIPVAECILEKLSNDVSHWLVVVPVG